jgi:hypothetical protein
MARWVGAAEAARIALAAHAVPTVAAVIVIVIIAAARVQDGCSADQKHCDGRERDTGSRQHWPERGATPKGPMGIRGSVPG